jgi:hypothetical protein
MGECTFENVCYLAAEKTWRNSGLEGWDDRGRLTVTSEGAVFQGVGPRIRMRKIARVRVTTQGRDLVNRWVRVDSAGEGDTQSAYFTDGRLPGWRGTEGRIGAMTEALRALNPALSVEPEIGERRGFRLALSLVFALGCLQYGLLLPLLHWSASWVTMPHWLFHYAVRLKGLQATLLAGVVLASLARTHRFRALRRTPFAQLDIALWLHLAFSSFLLWPATTSLSSLAAQARHPFGAAGAHPPLATTVVAVPVMLAIVFLCFALLVAGGKWKSGVAALLVAGAAGYLAAAFR